MENKTISLSETAITLKDTCQKIPAEMMPIEASLDLDELGILLKKLIEEGKLFAEPAKWERNIFCHSPGCLILTKSGLVFMPHLLLSVLRKTVIIPLGAIDRTELGDNFMMRGVMHIVLKESVGNRARYTFFLGNKRDEFVRHAGELLL